MTPPVLGTLSSCEAAAGARGAAAPGAGACCGAAGPPAASACGPVTPSARSWLKLVTSFRHSDCAQAGAAQPASSSTTITDFGDMGRGLACKLCLPDQRPAAVTVAAAGKRRPQSPLPAPGVWGSKCRLPAQL